jgi:hypothetical protein
VPFRLDDDVAEIRLRVALRVVGMAREDEVVVKDRTARSQLLAAVLAADEAVRLRLRGHG